MKTLLCLKGNFEALPVLQRAKALGHQLVVVDKDADAAGRPLADIFVQADHYSTEAVLQALHFSLNWPVISPDGVLSCCGDTPHVAAAVAATYDLPGLAPERAALSVDKLAQKTALRAAGLPVPGFLSADDDVWDMRDWPSVAVKPIDSRGARGVSLVLRHDWVAWNYAVARAKEASPSQRVMVEQYLPGPQLSTESIVVDGRVLFTAVGLRNYEGMEVHYPHMIENGFDMPYGDAGLVAEVNDVLARGCAALGWDNLTVKADLIVYRGRVVILELAARLSGGFLSTHGTAYSYGLDLVGAAIRLALGEPLDSNMVLPLLEPIPVCQRYLFPELSDIGRRVVSVPSLHEITTMTPVPPTLAHARKIERDLDGNHLWAINTGTIVSPMFTAKYATYSVRPGDVLRPVVDHGARLGQAIALGNTPTLARRKAEAAVKAMQEGLVLE